MERRAAIVIGRVMLACCVLVGGGHAKASEPAEGARPAITIAGAWARLNPIAGRPAAVYLTIVNHGRADDRLVAAHSAVAEGIEIHRQSIANGISRMRRLEALEVSAGAQVSLRPGDTHLMLIGPGRDLEKMRGFPLTLNFEVAGEIEIKVLIKNGLPF